MKTLHDILNNITPTAMLLDNRQLTETPAGRSVARIEFDSRKAAEGCLFVAQRGVHVDGHQYIGKAIEQGADAVVCEAIPEHQHKGVLYIQVEDSSNALGVMATPDQIAAVLAESATT